MILNLPIAPAIMSQKMTMRIKIMSMKDFHRAFRISNTDVKGVYIMIDGEKNVTYGKLRKRVVKIDVNYR